MQFYIHILHRISCLIWGVHFVLMSIFPPKCFYMIIKWPLVFWEHASFHKKLFHDSLNDDVLTLPQKPQIFDEFHIRNFYGVVWLKCLWYHIWHIVCSYRSNFEASKHFVLFTQIYLPHWYESMFYFQFSVLFASLNDVLQQKWYS